MTDTIGRQRSPAAIEREIDRTRAELALTLNALEHKLAARQIVEKGVEMFRDNLAMNQAMDRSLAIIRANPVPVALIGIGAAWLVANSTGVAERLAEDERIRAARERIGDMATNVGTKAGELASNVAGKVGLGGSAEGEQALGHTGHPIVDQYGRKERGNGWMHEVTGRAQGALRSARDSGSAMLNSEAATRVADRIGDAFERYPLAIGAIGIMAGALIAALLPMTRTENELLGGTRDELWQKAQQAGEQAVTQVREAASRTAARAVDAAAEAAAQTVRADIRGTMDKPPQG
jgi:hypothetical protein